MFIIGHLRTASTRKIFPIKRKDKETSTKLQKIGNIYPSGGQNGNVYNSEGLSPSLRSGQGVKGSGIGSNNAPKIYPCLTPGRLNKRQNGRRFKGNDDEMFTITSQDRHGVAIDGLNTTEEGNSYCIDSNYHKGTSPGDINSGRRTQIKSGTRIRKLTPKECWRLQGFPRIKEEGLVCYNNAKYVEKSLNTKEKEKLVPKTVHINYEGKTLVIHNQKKSFKFANGVEMKGKFLPHIKTEDFVVLSAGMLRTLEKTACCGKKGNLFTIALNTNIIKKCEKLEKDLSKIKGLVNAVEKDIKRNYTSIPTTKKVLNTKNLDMIIQILFYFVSRAMQPFISIEKKSLLKINIDWDWAFERAAEVNSDTQLYRQAGNSVTVPVIKAIGEELISQV